MGGCPDKGEVCSAQHITLQIACSSEALKSIWYESVAEGIKYRLARIWPKSGCVRPLELAPNKLEDIYLAILSKSHTYFEF